MHECQLLTAREVCELASISPATMYRLIRADRFPRPIKLGPQATRWRADEVREHIERLSESREARPA